MRDDPYNKYVHFVMSLSGGKHLALSDARKFAKITLLDSDKARQRHLGDLGPDALKVSFTDFKKRLRTRPKGKIVSVLMDQKIIAGVGNIYSDEILWQTGAHPESMVLKIPDVMLKKIYDGMKTVLKKGISFGGDSMSDYRAPNGLPGKFQLHHKAYRRTKEKCGKRDCGGVIMRKMIGGRSCHFCSIHQEKFVSL